MRASDTLFAPGRQLRERSRETQMARRLTSGGLRRPRLRTIRWSADRKTGRRGLDPPASRVGRGGKIGGGLWAFPLALWLAGGGAACAAPRPGSAPPAAEIATEAQAEGAAPAERSCAWYGDARDSVLYFGESAFWAAARAHGDPLADRLVPGPRRIGRFDLSRRRLLAPLDAGPGDAPTGVWDVLAHANGRVYFTTWFDAMGWVDPATGEVRRLDGLGKGLNEIAQGPAGTLLVSRYGNPDEAAGGGSVVIADLEGARVAELPLAAPAGYRAAPKTVAFDRVRDEIWATTDLFPLSGGPIRHDAYVLDRAGREKRRIERPEVQFVAFGPDGTGLLAEVEGARLDLRVRPPAGPDRVLAADAAFASRSDFVQDVHFAPDGRAVMTRWSGVVHVFDPPDSLATLRLPRLEPGGLYYSGVLAGERICATHCGGLTVVCVPADPERGANLELGGPRGEAGVQQAPRPLPGPGPRG
jgi:hypothetical protein